MTSEQLIFALTSWVFLTSVVYTFTGWRKFMSAIKCGSLENIGLIIILLKQ